MRILFGADGATVIRDDDTRRVLSEDDIAALLLAVDVAQNRIAELINERDGQGIPITDKFTVEPGEIDGLFSRLPPIFQKLVRKIADAPSYDFAAVELLDAFEIEWRKR